MKLFGRNCIILGLVAAIGTPIFSIFEPAPNPGLIIRGVIVGLGLIGFGWWLVRKDANERQLERQLEEVGLTKQEIRRQKGIAFFGEKEYLKQERQAHEAFIKMARKDVNKAIKKMQEGEFTDSFITGVLAEVGAPPQELKESQNQSPPLKRD